MFLSIFQSKYKGWIGILFFFVLFLLNNNLKSFIREFVETVKVVRVNSLKQKISNLNNVVLEEDVEVLVDHKIHLWADRVEIDKEQQYLVAEKGTTNSVIIETNDFLILADKFYFNLDNRTCFVENMRIHFSEGYLKAKKAEKLDENSWKMEDIVFTPCDAEVSHWSVVSESARLYSNYILRISGVIFKVGSIPLFILPVIALPLQNRSKSGLLLPKLSYDDELGFGFTQEYYWFIAPRCDTTIAVDWRDKMGWAFADEFRWARSTESLTLINSKLAFEKNAFVRKNNRIFQKTDQRYWVGGKDFRSFSDIVLGVDLSSLLRIDFGTDKKIGYQFFDETKNIDNTYYNSWCLRGSSYSDLLEISFDGNKTFRRRFLDFKPEQVGEVVSILNYDFTRDANVSLKREIEDKTEVYKFPHVEWGSIYKDFGKVFFYKQNCFVDGIFSREQENERLYFDSKQVKENHIVPLIKADSARFVYEGDLFSNIKFKNQMLQVYFSPRFDFRSNLKDRSCFHNKNVLEEELFSSSVGRLCLKGGAEWAFPEGSWHSEDYDSSYYFQPLLSWEFTPKFRQDHWYYSDEWDRIYPKNKLGIIFRNSWNIKNMEINFNISQEYDFYNNDDIYSLRRCPNQKNLLPLSLDLYLNCEFLNLFVSQEYNWKDFVLLQNQIDLSFSLKKFKLSLLTLYQNEQLRENRELLADIPHTVIFSISVPLFKKSTLSYDGQFYSKKKSQIFPFEGLRPLLHRVRLDYRGHCWGVSFGYEEKRYKQYGNWKSERAFSLYVKLDSLGSFARKFKRPTSYLN